MWRYPCILRNPCLKNLLVNERLILQTFEFSFFLRIRKPVRLNVALLHGKLFCQSCEWTTPVVPAAVTLHHWCCQTYWCSAGALSSYMYSVHTVYVITTRVMYNGILNRNRLRTPYIKVSSHSYFIRMYFSHWTMQTLGYQNKRTFNGFWWTIHKFLSHL